MIAGRFGDTTGRPYVSGRLLLPRVGLATNLSFLVDTGADFSTLMPGDGIKMKLDYPGLKNPTTVGGMGGNAACYQEQAILLFHEPDRKLMRAYAITLMIPRLDPDLFRMPSLLGRDVLDRWHMSYDPSRGKLSFTVRSADHTIETA